MKRTFVSAAIFVSLLMASTVITRAQALSLYAATGSGNFGTLNPLTGQFTQIGASGVFGSDHIGGLAFGTGGKLYGLGYNGAGNSELFQISLTTGNATLIGTGGAIGAGYGLTSTPNGTLYAFLDPNNITTLYTVNPTNGADTQIGVSGTELLYGNIAASQSGLLYINPGYGTEQLYNLNASTGQGTLIGNTGTANSYAIAYDNSNLYLVGLNGVISSLNTSTGAGTAVSTYNNAEGQIYALASANAFASPSPTPEPTSLALAALGMAALVLRQRRG